MLYSGTPRLLSRSYFNVPASLTSSSTTFSTFFPNPLDAGAFGGSGAAGGVADSSFIRTIELDMNEEDGKVLHTPRHRELVTKAEEEDKFPNSSVMMESVR